MDNSASMRGRLQSDATTQRSQAPRRRLYESFASRWPSKLLNKNCAMDANERRRLANKRWRDAHPGYMAQKSREARQRRRLALETEGDTN